MAQSQNPQGMMPPMMPNQQGGDGWGTANLGSATDGWGGGCMPQPAQGNMNSWDGGSNSWGSGNQPGWGNAPQPNNTGGDNWGGGAGNTNTYGMNMGNMSGVPNMNGDQFSMNGGCDGGFKS